MLRRRSNCQAEKLLKKGREIWIEWDTTDKKDGRLLRYVWVKQNNGDAYLLNEVMIRDGFAVYVPSTTDDKRAARLEKAQAGVAARPSCPASLGCLRLGAGPGVRRGDRLRLR